MLLFSSCNSNWMQAVSDTSHGCASGWGYSVYFHTSVSFEIKQFNVFRCVFTSHCFGLQCCNDGCQTRRKFKASFSFGWQQFSRQENTCTANRLLIKEISPGRSRESDLMILMGPFQFQIFYKSQSEWFKFHLLVQDFLKTLSRKQWTVVVCDGHGHPRGVLLVCCLHSYKTGESDV